MNNFMIFGPARSGTTTLAGILIANEISVMYEPFNLQYHNYQNEIKKHGLDKTMQMIFAKKNGAKHLFHQLSEQQNKHLIQKIPTIFIYRNNFFDASLSFLVANKTNIWKSEQVNYKNDYLKSIKLDAYEVFKYAINLREQTNFYIDFVKNNSKAILFSYEELYSDQGINIIKNIFQFLNKPLVNEEKTLELLSPKYKLNKKPWNEIISNYKDIEKNFIKL